MNAFPQSARSSRKTMPQILHITPRSQWESAKAIGAAYRADSLDSEGFIHCSRVDQVVAVANRFYAGQTDLVLLVIQSDRLQAPLRYEAADGDEFPHLYGALNLDAVVAAIALSSTDFEAGDEGFVLPLELGEALG
jgi:uncharacterized protein (DUF952 family)